MVIDPGEAGQGEGEAQADQLAQGADVGLGLHVLALVLDLGVDHQAVGSVPHGLGADLGLLHRVIAVHVLPGAHAQPRLMQGGDQRRVELRPHAGAVAALDEQRADPVRMRLGDDRAEIPSVRARQHPDPHAPALEGPQRRAGRDGEGGRHGGRAGGARFGGLGCGKGQACRGCRSQARAQADKNPDLARR